MADMVVKTLEKELIAARKEKKILFAHLINEILVKAGEQSIREIVESIGRKLRFLIGELVQSCDDPNNIKRLIAMVNTWAYNKLFAPQFTQRLKKGILEPAYTKLIKRPEPQEKPQRYNKTFIMEYQMLKRNEATRAIYENALRQNQFEGILAKFNSQFNNLELNQPPQSQFMKRRIDEMLTFGYQYKAELLELISKQQEAIRTLSNSCLDLIK